MLHKVKIVLVEPSHPGNIGAVARSMKTMGLSQLVLVKPKKFPHSEATKRAAGAQSVLESALVVESVSEALHGCVSVLGTSVRDREVRWPTVNPRQAAGLIQKSLSTPNAEDSQAHAAILFGRENSGLTNQELELCHTQIRIPANPHYSSLNLGSAVQIIAYEISVLLSDFDGVDQFGYKLAEKQKPTAAELRQLPATAEQKSGHLQHLIETLESLDFIKAKPPTVLMRKLTRLYNKADLSVEEIQILRGILAAIQSQQNRSLD